MIDFITSMSPRDWFELVACIVALEIAFFIVIK